MTPRTFSLLHSDDSWSLPTELYSCWNARGLYNPLQFVLRLRPDLHRALNSAPAGLVTRSEVSDEQMSAFSTYLHETIHWWQHVGSTTGFILSLIYPAQSHINHRHLKAILKKAGPIKSIRNHNLQQAKLKKNDPELESHINTALNNWHDIEYYRWIVTDPIKSKSILKDAYFESVGHSYDMAITSILWLLSSTIDPNLKIFPDPRKWEDKSRELRQRKVHGFYYGSPIALPPIGAREIFEGQARFSQLQYIYFSSGKTTLWNDFEEAGMFQGVYVAAFKIFLEITEFEQPSKLDDSSIGLFLLVCDIAINPSEFFIEETTDVENIIEIHDPGIRFLRLCISIKNHRERFISAIVQHSPKEYWETSNELCSLTGFKSPQSLIQRVVSWTESHQEIASLLDEDKTFKFSLENLPVRVFLARFIRLQMDKAINPEFFCWPGVWMTTARDDGISPDTALALFEEHRAIFLDKEDGDVYPRTFNDRDESSVLETFNTFYSWVVTYELTRQWLVEPGDFEYDFYWLTSKYTQNEVCSWASSKFEEAFGIPPAGFQIIADH